MRKMAISSVKCLICMAYKATLFDGIWILGTSHLWPYNSSGVDAMISVGIPILFAVRDVVVMAFLGHL